MPRRTYRPLPPGFCGHDLGVVGVLKVAEKAILLVNGEPEEAVQEPIQLWLWRRRLRLRLLPLRGASVFAPVPVVPFGHVILLGDHQVHGLQAPLLPDKARSVLGNQCTRADSKRQTKWKEIEPERTSRGSSSSGSFILCLGSLRRSFLPLRLPFLQGPSERLGEGGFARLHVGVEGGGLGVLVHDLAFRLWRDAPGAVVKGGLKGRGQLGLLHAAHGPVGLEVDVPEDSAEGLEAKQGEKGRGGVIISESIELVSAGSKGPMVPPKEQTCSPQTVSMSKDLRSLPAPIARRSPLVRAPRDWRRLAAQ